MKTTVDLNKVQYARFWWRNQFGMELSKKPLRKSYNGIELSDDIMMPAVGEPYDWPREAQVDRAKRRGLIDTWLPHVRLQFAANHSVTYAGKRAQSIWKEWNRRQFKKK